MHPFFTQFIAYFDLPFVSFPLEALCLPGSTSISPPCAESSFTISERVLSKKEMTQRLSHSALGYQCLSLLQAYAPNSRSLFTSLVSLVNSLCRLLQASADHESFPALSLSIFLWMSNPIPRLSLRCTLSLPPLKLRPSSRIHRVGSFAIFRTATSVRTMFSRLQVFLYV
jgi:hypothetical protein